MENQHNHWSEGPGDQKAHNTSEWKQYRRTNVAEMRAIVKGEDFEGISISGPDNQLRYDDPATFDLGFVARNPQCHADQWYVSRTYFDANFEAI